MTEHTTSSTPRQGLSRLQTAFLVMLAALLLAIPAWAVTKVVLADTGLQASANPAIGLKLDPSTSSWNATGAHLRAGSGYVAARRATATTVYANDRDTLIGVTSTAAVRGVYMPDSSSTTATPIAIGLTIVVVDESGAAGTNNIRVYPLGSDTVNGGAYTSAGYGIASNYGKATLYYAGAHKWIAY